MVERFVIIIIIHIIYNQVEVGKIDDLLNLNSVNDDFKNILDYIFYHLYCMFRVYISYIM